MNSKQPDPGRIDICGAHPGGTSAKSWGDLHFAAAMKNAFERAGYRARGIFGSMV